MTPLVSIIIPTFNRAHLLGETLDSIIKQTYENWECIIVDDHSWDFTEELMEFYTEKDLRIKYFKRPKKFLKGANACRNYGLKMSKGKYINFFDSDDLMTDDFIKVKFDAINSGNFDYSISKTTYFNSDIWDEHYDFNSEDINNHNYVTQKVNWLTYDAFIKRTIAKRISFNNKLQSGQEFNYFAKLTSISNRAILVDKYVTLRRYHQDSIRGSLREDKDALLKSIFKAHWYTYLDLRKSLHKETCIYLLRRCTIWFFNFNQFYRYFSFRFFCSLWRDLSPKKAINYALANVTNYLFGKGYYFIKRARS